MTNEHFELLLELEEIKLMLISISQQVAAGKEAAAQGIRKQDAPPRRPRRRQFRQRVREGNTNNSER